MLGRRLLGVPIGTVRQSLNSHSAFRVHNKGSPRKPLLGQFLDNPQEFCVLGLVGVGKDFINRIHVDKAVQVLRVVPVERHDFSISFVSDCSDIPIVPDGTSIVNW